MVRSSMLYAVTVAIAASTFSAEAAPISYTGVDYTQGFDTLPNTPPGQVINSQGVGPIDVPTSTMGIPLDGWTFFKASGSGANAFFTVDDGSNVSGATYSYGTGSDVDRALGSVASGTTISSFGATFVNNTATTLTSFTLSYTGEQWRVGSAAANTLAFSYGVGVGSLSAGPFLAATSLNLVSPVVTAGSSALDGNLPANQVAKNATISGFFWAPGTSLTIRWADANDGGSDDGLAVDNLTFSAASSSFRTLTWNTTDGDWNTTSPNWSGSDTIYQNGDVVQFQDGHQGVVNIDAGGVAPGMVKVEHTTGTYTLQGGAVTGSSAIIKSGAGVLALSSEIQSTGGLTINGGTVQTPADERLSNSAPVTVNAGLLDLQGHKETVGGFFIAGGGTIDSGAAGQLIMGASSAVIESSTPAVIAGKFSSTNATNAINVANGSGNVDLQFDAVFVNGQRVVFGGTGTTRISADSSTFNSGITLGSGRMIITNKAALGGGSASLGQFFFNGGTLESEVPLIGADAIIHAVSVGGNVTFNATQPMELKDLRTSFGGAAALMTVIGDLRVTAPIGFANVINKGGAGTLTLTEVNPYSGTTFVRAGMLKLTGNGAITASPTISVSSGAQIDMSALAGQYTFGATQVVQGGGTLIAPASGILINGFLSPGGSADGLNTETLTFQGGPLAVAPAAFSLFDISGTTEGLFDKLAIIGQALTLDGELTLSLAGDFTPSASDEFTIITSDGGIAGQFANVVNGRVPIGDEGYSFLLTQDGDRVVLSDYAVVPEPKVWGLLAIGFALFLLRSIMEGKSRANGRLGSLAQQGNGMGSAESSFN
jgi:autotransporter-associated beta strand protein